MIIKRSGQIICIVFCITLFFAWACLGPKTDESTVIKNHSISIELFPKEHTFKATDEMRIEHKGKNVTFYFNKSFYIHSIVVKGKRADFRQADMPEEEKGEKLEDKLTSDFSRAGIVTISIKHPGEHTLILNYEGKLFEAPKTSQFSREYIANQTAGIISEQGVFLSPESFWYPRGDEKMSQFEVRVTTPSGYEAITQGTLLKHEIKSDKLIAQWKNVHPSDSLYLQAGPYEIQEDEVDGIKVYTYFFPGGDKLASLYLRKSKQYIAMYNRLLGRYPYDKFAVVENFFETGFGMPSWTLLGKTVIRLPFIPDTSLPHEICHNWWGNGVFVNYDEGNWCEGLTVYCADYLMKKKETPGAAGEYRRQINRDYASYVKKNNDFPLTEFHSRHDPATRAVGYGKTMMVFHDLLRRVGEDKFFKSLRQLMEEYRFKSATWQDVLGVFKKVCGVNLNAFYSQWVERTGAPVLRLKKVRSIKQESGFLVTFTIVQEGEPYDLEVPVLITTTDPEVRKNVKVIKDSEEFEVRLAAKPFRLEVDPDHHLFRRLHPEEIPSSIAKVFGSESQFIVLGSGGEAEKLEQYKTAADMINKTKTAVIKSDKEIRFEELNSRSIIILGPVSEETAAAEFLRSLQMSAPWDRKLAEKEDSAGVVVYDHPRNIKYGVMVIRGNSKSDVVSVARKLPHYGKYSYLLFHGDKNIVKGIWEIVSSPLIYLFY